MRYRTGLGLVTHSCQRVGSLSIVDKLCFILLSLKLCVIYKLNGEIKKKSMTYWNININYWENNLNCIGQGLHTYLKNRLKTATYTCSFCPNIRFFFNNLLAKNRCSQWRSYWEKHAHFSCTWCVNVNENCFGSWAPGHHRCQIRTQTFSVCWHTSYYSISASNA